MITYQVEGFIQEVNVLTRRSVIFEDDGIVAYLYLTQPDTLAVTSHLWIYNRVEAPNRNDLAKYRKTPPPAPIGYASTNSPTIIPPNCQLHFVWSTDGNAVALFMDNQLIAHLSDREERHFSLRVIHSGPWGNPWQADAYQSVVNSGSIDFLSQ